MGVFLKGHEVIEGVDIRQAASVDEAHEEVAYVGAVLGAEEEAVPAMANRHLQDPFHRVDIYGRPRGS